MKDGTVAKGEIYLGPLLKKFYPGWTKRHFTLQT